MLTCLLVFLLALLPSRSFVSHHVSQHPRPRHSSINDESFLQQGANPNDEETPQERQARMALVRKIQANFYASDKNQQEQWLQTDPHDPTVLYNLPLWRVQWTELPGFQNVLNVHEPHYTHMFRTLLLKHQPPWYFGHLYLPGGSENLGNPEFALPAEQKETTITESSLPTLDELKQQVKVTTIATLMQVTDYIEQDDGRLTLIVQAVDRIEILGANQQVPHAVAAKVRLVPDTESWYDLHVKPNVGQQAPLDLTLRESLQHAMQAVAVRQGQLLRPLEYHATTTLDQTIKDSNNNLPLGGVSSLTNVNASARVDFDAMHQDLQKVYLQVMATKAQDYGSDEILIAATTMSVQNTSTITHAKVAALEVDLWVSLDRMIRLLEQVQPPTVRIPVPTQLLSLLPTNNVTWPAGFRLETFAKSLQATQARVGTLSQTPFCRISEQYPLYPPIRRASRLSYAIWALLEGIGVGRVGLTRQDLLQMASVQKRLQATLKYLEAINEVIEQMME